jgi:hypothetical protein
VALPLQIGSDLAVRIGAEVVTLTPSQGLRAAEQLIRKSTRLMMIEEALPVSRRRLPTTLRRPN